MSKALIIIDIQNDYFQGGNCELVNPMEASLKAKELLPMFSPLVKENSKKQ